MNPEMTPVRSRTSEMVIRDSMYVVTTSFNDNAHETIEDKLVRYVADRISSAAK